MGTIDNVEILEGFDHGANTTVLNGNLYSGAANANCISAASRHTDGGGGLRIIGDSSANAGVGFGGAASAKLIRLYFKFNQFPNSDAYLFWLGKVSGATHSCGIRWNNATQSLRSFAYTTTSGFQNGSDGLQPTINTWYRLDAAIGTNSVVWQINGVSQPTGTFTVSGGGSLGVFLIGRGNSDGSPTTTMSLDIDDLLVAWYAGDNIPLFPLGSGRVFTLFPNGDGTHSNSSHFIDDSGNSPPSSPFSRVNKNPIGTSTTPNVGQQTGNANSYLEYTMEDLPGSVPDLPVRSIQTYVGYNNRDGGGFLIEDLNVRAIINSISYTFVSISKTYESFVEWDRSALETANTFTKTHIDGMVVRHGYDSTIGARPGVISHLFATVELNVADTSSKLNYGVASLLYKPTINPIPATYYSPGTPQAYEDARFNTGFEHGSLSHGVYTLGKGTFKAVVGDVSIDTSLNNEGGQRSLKLILPSTIEPPPPPPDPEEPPTDIVMFEGTRMRFGATVEGDPVGIYSRDGLPSTALQRLDYLEEIYDAPYRCIRVFRRWNEETWDKSYEREVAWHGLWMSEKAKNLNNSIVRYDEIARGDHNAHIRQRADEIKALNLNSPIPFILFTFQHEPEGEQSSVDWSQTPHGTQAAAYKAAYRQYRDIFLRRLQNDNGGPAYTGPVAFGPIFYAISYNDGTADTLWPGDDVCDFAGADGYNWHPAPGEGPYRNFSHDVISGSLKNFGIAHNKYVCMGEVGTFETAPATYDSGAVSGPTTRWDSTTFSVPTGPPYDRYPADAEFTDREATTPGNTSKAAWIDRMVTTLKSYKFTTGEKAGHYVFQVVCWYDATGNYNRYSNTTPTAIAAISDLMTDTEFNPNPPEEPEPNPEPEPTDTMHNAAGTWTIKQVANTSALNAAAGDINLGLVLEGVRGFGARIPWNVIEVGRLKVNSATQGANTLRVTNTYNARITAGTILFFHHGTGMTADVRVRVRSDYTAGQTQLLVDPIPSAIGAGARAGIYNDTLLEQAFALPNAKAKKFKPRIICGRYTPSHVFDDGSPSFLDGTTKIPMPFGTGGSTNTQFEYAWEDMMRHLFRWARSKNNAAGKNVVPMIDAGWYSNNYSELYFGPEVQNAFGDGFSTNETRFITAHTRLINLAFPMTTANICVGFGLSGHGPLSQRIAGSLAESMRTASGVDFSRKIFMQANGWGPSGDWGTTATNEQVFDTNVWPKKVSRGEQDVHPANSSARTAPNWITMYGYLRTNNATYAEIYAEQFKVSTNLQTQAGLDEMKRQIAEWWRVLGGAAGGGGGGDGGDPDIPTITSFTPTSGQVGASVTINGTNLDTATAVTFNGVNSSFTPDSGGTKIIAIVPNNATTGRISVVTPDGTATSGTNFTVTTSGGGGGGGDTSAPRIAGTWVLQQVSTLSTLNTGTTLHTNITRALQNFDTTGFSIRVPWNILEPTQGNYDFSIFARALQIAAANNKYCMVRFMAGRHTPTFYKGSANNGHLIYEGTAGQGTVDQGLGVGSTIPLAFMSNGSKNMVFWNGLMNIMTAVKNWCNQNGVKMMHAAWPGLLWSEIAYIQQMIDGGQAFNYAGQPGHTFNMVSQFHVDEINNLASRSSASFYTELSVSGHVVNHQLFSNVHNALLNHANKNYVFFSSNNIGYAWRPGAPDSDMLKGLPISDRRFRRGGQMVGLRNDYPWNTVFSMLQGGPSSTNECFEYLEIYTESFRGGNEASLRSNITAHKPSWL